MERPVFSLSLHKLCCLKLSLHRAKLMESKSTETVEKTEANNEKKPAPTHAEGLKDLRNMGIACAH